MARGCPFTCSLLQPVEIWRDYRIRDPKIVGDEIVELKGKHQVGFFILADESRPSTRRSSWAFCKELIDRNVDILWASTRASRTSCVMRSCCPYTARRD